MNKTLATLLSVKRSAQRQIITQLQRLAHHKSIYCLGDSHITMFAHVQKRQPLKKTHLICREVRGATASGIANPNSQTNAVTIFRAEISHVPKTAYLLFLLGEVDCGFAIWYRASKHELSVENQLELSLTNYQNFVLSVQEQGYQQIILVSVPLPTIADGQDWGEIANARREVTATLAERTELTHRFNARLRAFCQQQGFLFLDYEAEITDPASGLLRSQFIHHDPLNHHLAPKMMAPLLVQKLNALGFE